MTKLTAIEYVLLFMILLILSIVTMKVCLSSDDTTTAPASVKVRAKSINWETLQPHANYTCYRASTPTGWIVYYGGGITFVPDPNHEWLK